MRYIFLHQQIIEYIDSEVLRIPQLSYSDRTLSLTVSSLPRYYCLQQHGRVLHNQPLFVVALVDIFLLLRFVV